MFDIMANQFLKLAREQGFDPEKVRDQVKSVVDDIHAMKESQDRCEAMLRKLYGLHFDEKPFDPTDIRTPMEIAHAAE
jgi:hypothetical protein